MMIDGWWFEAGGETMKYLRFEDLPVWNAAIDLAARTFAMTATGRLKGYAGLRDQIERAAVSVSNNIAEGFERGTHEELLTFLYIARGSAAEVRSMLCLLERLPATDGPPDEIVALRELTRDITHQLNRWLEKLKESHDRGPRYRNAATKRAAQGNERRDRFLAELRRVQEGHRPPRPPETFNH
jgi:four helix bundle protein